MRVRVCGEHALQSMNIEQHKPGVRGNVVCFIIPSTFFTSDGFTAAALMRTSTSLSLSIEGRGSCCSCRCCKSPVCSKRTARMLVVCWLDVVVLVLEFRDSFRTFRKCDCDRSFPSIRFFGINVCKISRLHNTDKTEQNRTMRTGLFCLLFVCVGLSLSAICTAEPIQVDMPARLRATGFTCGFCEFVVFTIKTYLTENSTEQEIAKVVAEICTYIPQEYQGIVSTCPTQIWFHGFFAAPTTTVPRDD